MFFVRLLLLAGMFLGGAANASKKRIAGSGAFNSNGNIQVFQVSTFASVQKLVDGLSDYYKNIFYTSVKDIHFCKKTQPQIEQLKLLLNWAKKQRQSRQICEFVKKIELDIRKLIEPAPKKSGTSTTRLGGRVGIAGGAAVGVESPDLPDEDFDGGAAVGAPERPKDHTFECWEDALEKDVKKDKEDEDEGAA